MIARMGIDHGWCWRQLPQKHSAEIRNFQTNQGRGTQFQLRTLPDLFLRPSSSERVMELVLEYQDRGGWGLLDRPDCCSASIGCSLRSMCSKLRYDYARFLLVLPLSIRGEA